MTPSPDSTERIRKAITDKYHKSCAQRLLDMERRVAQLIVEARLIAADMRQLRKDYSGEVSNDTTYKIQCLPDPEKDTEHG